MLPKEQFYLPRFARTTAMLFTDQSSWSPDEKPQCHEDGSDRFYPPKSVEDNTEMFSRLF